LQSIAKKKENWTIIDLINWGEDYFNKNQFESPKQEIEWLLCDLLNYKRVDLYVNFEEIVSPGKLAQLKKWIKKRLNRMPLQYITGNTEFYGNKFFLNKDVLIPRPETERLVDISLQCIEKINDPNILEVGTGSGCISISLALKREDAHILSLDISDNALIKAKENADYHKTENVRFTKVDILNELPDGKFDIIISNPPYISYDEMQDIMIDVKDFEPELALTDYKDGLLFYARLSDIGPTLIKKGGWMLLEVGINDHPNKVMSLFESKGYKNIDLLTDYNNNKRVLRVKI
tara:strand:- start:2451 stop:3323 length:873 start_codon:yes stop_codon:yes gene_type:complete